MNFTFNYYKELDNVELYLCKPDETELFTVNAYNKKVILRFNDLSKIEFDVPYSITDGSGQKVLNCCYEMMQTARLIHATHIGWFRITSVTENDSGTEPYKAIEAESLQSIFKNRGFISEDRVYRFFDSSDPTDANYDSKNLEDMPSVVGQLYKQLGIAPPGMSANECTSGWRILNISNDLMSMCRGFKENTTFGYDWMMNDVGDAFGAVFIFDFENKTISIRTVEEAVQNTNLCLSFYNFMKNIEVAEDASDITTVLSCNGENVDITEVNPTGTNYVVDFSYFMDEQGRWMSQDLIHALNDWKACVEDNQFKYDGYVRHLRELYSQQEALDSVLKALDIKILDLTNLQDKVVSTFNKTLGTPLGEISDYDMGILHGTFATDTVKLGHNSYINTDVYDRLENITNDSSITYYTQAPSYQRVDEETGYIWKWDAQASGTVDIKNLSFTEDNVSNAKYYFMLKDGSGNYITDCYCMLNFEAYNDSDSGTPIIKYRCSGYTSYTQASLVFESPYLRNRGFLCYVGKIKAKYETLRKWIASYANNVDETNVPIKSDIPKGLYDAYMLQHLHTNDNGESAPFVADGLAFKIQDTNEKIKSITDECNIIRYLGNLTNGASLLRELYNYWIEGDYTNANIVSYDTTTDSEYIGLAKELKEAGQVELQKVSQPRYSFSVSVADAIKSYEFRDQMSQLILGGRIAVEKEDGVWYSPALLEISFSLDDGEDMNLSFANNLRLDDWGYTYADLISGAVSTSRQVSANWHNITDYSNNKERINDMLDNPLDLSLRAGSKNVVNKDFVVDKNGILGRKFIEESSSTSGSKGIFEPEQLRISNNLITFTSDGWDTVRTALGKVYYQDENGNPKSSYGLLAETIVGDLIIGNELKIGNKNKTVAITGDGIFIKQDDKVVFSADNAGNLVIGGKFSIGDGGIKMTPTDIYIGQNSEWVISSAFSELTMTRNDGMEIKFNQPYIRGKSDYEGEGLGSTGVRIYPSGVYYYDGNYQYAAYWWELLQEKFRGPNTN